MRLYALLYTLLHGTDKGSIAAAQGVRKARILESWMRSLHRLRNIVCHGGRLLRRSLPFGPINSPRTHIKLDRFKDKYYARAVVIYHLLPREKALQWRSDLLTLFDEYKEIQGLEVGFDPGWESTSLWKRPT